MLHNQQVTEICRVVRFLFIYLFEWQISVILINWIFTKYLWSLPHESSLALSDYPQFSRHCLPTCNCLSACCLNLSSRFISTQTGEILLWPFAEHHGRDHVFQNYIFICLPTIIASFPLFDSSALAHQRQVLPLTKIDACGRSQSCTHRHSNFWMQLISSNRTHVNVF